MTAASIPARRALALAGLVQLSWIHVLHPLHPTPIPTLQLMWKIKAVCQPHQNAGKAIKTGRADPQIRTELCFLLGLQRRTQRPWREVVHGKSLIGNRLSSGRAMPPGFKRCITLLTTLHHWGTRKAIRSFCVRSQSWNIHSSSQEKKGEGTTQIIRL